ncbi:MAG: nucleoid-associated protein [Anaerovoracaceae bacterium]
MKRPPVIFRSKWRNCRIILPDEGADFLRDSAFLADLRKYRSEELSFAEFSAQTARILHRYLSLAGEERPVDVLFADFSEEDSRFVGFWLLNNDEAYMHRAVSGDGQVKAEIARHHAILPKPSQKTDSYALIRLDSEEIFFTDRKRSIDGEDRFVLPELLLKCTSAVSGREAIKTLQEVAAAVAEKHGENSAVAVSKVKNFLIENAKISGTLAPQRLVREALGTSEEKQREFLQEIEEKRDSRVGADSSKGGGERRQKTENPYGHGHRNLRSLGISRKSGFY